VGLTHHGRLLRLGLSLLLGSLSFLLDLFLGPDEGGGVSDLVGLDEHPGDAVEFDQVLGDQWVLGQGGVQEQRVLSSLRLVQRAAISSDVQGVVQGQLLLVDSELLRPTRFGGRVDGLGVGAILKIELVYLVEHLLGPITD